MKVTRQLITAVVVMLLSSFFPSCESVDGPDSPRPTADIIIRTEYIGLDEFKGDMSRIVVFVTDTDDNFISSNANEIKENTFIATVSPGKYVVSAEYIASDSNETNIVLDSFPVEVKDWQVLETPLKINLNKIAKL